MRTPNVVMLSALLAAATACSGDADDAAAVPELDAQAAGEIAVEPLESDFTVDTQVVRVPGAPARN